MQLFSNLLKVTLLALLVTGTALSGVSRYVVARDSTAGNYTAIAGSTFASWTVTFVGIGADDGYSAVTSIGFPFVYDGVTYNEFRATANGCIVLGPQSTAETFTNDLASTTHKPLLAPYWDDLATVSTNNVTYQLTGSAGSRVLTVQFLNFVNNPNAGGPFNFQCKLYEADNHIEFVYGAMGTSATYSTGLNDPIGGVGHFLSLSAANGSTFSSTTATNTLAVAPGQDLKYSFSPPTRIASDITVTPGAGAYPTVQSAMDTLSFYGTSGNRNVFVSGTTTEPAAVGNWDFIPGTHPGAGNFTVTLRLAVGVSAATITGNFAGDAFRLRGQRNLVIDGDDPTAGGTQRALTISNTNAAAAGRTLVLLEGTQGAVIKNSILTSNALSGAAATFGVVTILTSNISTATTTRGVYGSNDFNIIENNDIREGSTNRPTNCILMSGTTTAGLRNTGNIIRLNDIRNYGGSTATRGIRLEANDSLTVIDRNNIFTLTTTIADVRGIMVNAATVFGTQIIGNRIYDQLSTAAAATIQGIRLFSAVTGSPALVANNFIYIDAPAGLTTGTVGGIDQSTGLVDVVYNSVRIGGTVTAGTTGSTAAYRRIGSSTGVIRDNIFFNAATNGGGTSTHWAIVSGANTGLNSNHNDLFVNGVGGIVGTTDGATTGNRTTLFDWQNATGQDLNSLSTLPPFTSATDLHIPNGTSTGLESGGVTAGGVTTDIDGTTRASYSDMSGPNSAPDIGADEFNGVLADATPPNIAYTTLLNTPSTASRPLAVRVRDAASGVQRSVAGAPRLWFRKNSGAYVQVSGVEAGGDTFNFLFDHSLVGGVTAGDTIFYYVAAQDSSGIVGTVPAGTGGTVNPPNATVTAPNSYRILLTLTGTFNVGSAQPYANLGAIFGYINGNAVGGNLTVNITSDIAETGTATLNEPFSVGGPWSITISPTGGVWTDTGNVAGALIDLNGADNVTFNGNIAGTKSLRFRNTNTTAPATTFTLRNDATNNTITNCYIEGSATAGTVSIGTGVTTGNSSNTISNNDIRDRSDTGVRHAIGILSAGSAAAPNSANTISNNNIFNFTSTGVSVTATGNGGGWTISGNSFYYNNATVPTTQQTSMNFIPGLAANSNLIYGNFIGGQAPNAGGAAWTNNAASQFAGLLATVGTTTQSIIRKNTVKNISLTNAGTSPFFGLAVVNGSATVDSNTIGDPTFVSRPVFIHTVPDGDAPVRLEPTGVDKNGAVFDVQSPEQLAVTDHTETPTTGPVGSPLVTPATVPNSIQAAGTSAMTGIQNQSTAVVVIANNEVSNMTSLGTATTVSVRGINNSGTATSNTTISGNSIHDLMSASTSATLTAPAAVGIQWFPGGFTATLGAITGNTVRSIQGANSGTAATNPTGMLITNCDIPVTRNHVSDIRNASTGVNPALPPTASGFYMRALSAPLIANNMVSVGNGQTTNTTFTAFWNGSGTVNTGFMYHNSGLVTGAADSGALSSFGFLRGNHTATTVTTSFTMRNNIFVNARSGGAGKHYGVGNQGSAPATNWGSASSNHNVLNSPSAATIGLWGTTDQTLAEWQSVSLGDSQTVAGNPGFVSATDLHIQTSSPVPSNNGTPVAAVTIDYDGDSRSGTTPDRGADEYTAVPLPPPVVSGVARTKRVPVAGDTVAVTCTITDTLGIGTANLLYNINGSPNLVAMVLTGGTPTNGTYRGVVPGSANADGNRIELQIQANSTSGSTTTTAISTNNSYFAGVSPLSLSGVKAVGPNRILLYDNYYARVTGTINGPNYQTTNLGYFLQDAVGGINLFRAGTTIPALALGDSIVVVGRMDQFNGLTEITPDTVSVDIVIVATGRPVTPISIGVAAFNANPELYESRLVSFSAIARRDATPPWPNLGGSANIVIYQSVVTDTVIMRIDSDTEIDGSPEPTYPVNIVGIAGQFSTPGVFNNGYQVQPRYLTDFSPVGSHDIGVLSLGAGSSPDAPSGTGELSRGMDDAATAGDAGDVTGGASITITPLLEGTTDFDGNAPLNFRALVRNYGGFVEPTYQVGWTIDGVAQTAVNQPRPLQVGATDTVTLTWAVPTEGAHVARAFTILGTDVNHSNDTSAPYNFNVLPEGVVFQEGFNGTIPPYPSGWHVKNLDGGGTTTYFQGNPAVFPAFEGASYIGVNYQAANGFFIDQWLVTPNTGGLSDEPLVDSLIFWQRAPGLPNFFPDSLQIRVSTTDTNAASFTTVLDYFRVDTSFWRRKAFALPSGANRYIAFRYLIYDGGPSGANSNYVGIDAVQIKRAYVPAAGWVTQTSGAATPLNSVKAIDATTGWIAGNGTRVLRTTTGGDTWTNVGGGAITADIYAIDAVDASTAFATTSPAATFIYRTTNAGTSWAQVYTDASAGAFINAIKMFDATNGMAMGDPVGGRWVIIRTSNGGATWVRDTVNAPLQVGTEAGSNNGLAAVGSTHIWFCSNTTPSKVYRTTNGGTSWSGVNLPFSATFTAGIAFNSTQYGVVGANGGQAARTTDGGATWTSVTIPGTGAIYGVTGSGLDFFITRGANVYRSTDRGATWAISYTGAIGTFNHISFATTGSTTRGWGVTATGGIAAFYGSVTGVDDGTVEEIPQSFAVMQNYPNPFNPTTTLRYSIPQASHVMVKIYNMLGQEMVTLRDEIQSVGFYDVVWNGRNAIGAPIASGVYFYRVEARPVDGGNVFTSIKKMLMLK